MTDVSPEGSPGWLEIGVPETDATREFFAGLFGWRVEPMRAGNANFAGPGLRAGLHGGDNAREIIVYFSVADIEAAVSRVRELGGKAEDPGPEERLGRFASATDPQGVHFGLYQAPGTAT
jgi:predicted enzyme related to lactoylglutathione lyase